jgi:hypothetical protein
MLPKMIASNLVIPRPVALLGRFDSSALYPYTNQAPLSTKLILDNCMSA